MAAQGQRVAEILLRYKVEDSAIKNVERANATLTNNIKAVGAGTRELSENAKKAQAELVKLAQAGKIDASGFSAAAREIALTDARAEGLNEALKETKLRLSTLGDGDEFEAMRLQVQLLENEVNSVNQAIDNAGRGRPSTQGGVDRAGAVDSAFGRASSIVSAIPGGGELANAAGLIADISAGVGELPQILSELNIPVGQLMVAAPLAAGAVALLAVGVANFQRVTAEARANLEAALVAQQNYYQAVATLDEEGARQRITDLERNIDAQRQYAEEARAAADSAFNQLAGQIGDAGARALFAVDATAQSLVSTADEAEAGLAAMEQEAARLQQGLDEGAFAANNAADAQEQLAVSTEEATQATLNAIQQRIAGELEYAHLSANASSESIRARIEENELRQRLLEEEIAELEALAAAGDAVAQQALPELREQLVGLQADTQRLSTEVLGAAEARERENRSRERQEEAAEEAAQAEEDRQRAVEESTQAITASEQKIGEIRAQAVQRAKELEDQRLANIKKANETANTAFIDLARKNNKAISDEDKRYMQDEIKATEKFQRELQKSDAANKKELLRAAQDLHDSLLTAEEDNDVIAFIRAQREGNKQLSRMQEDADTETQIRIEQFQAERAESLANHVAKLEEIKQATIAERDAIIARRDEAIKAANDQAAEQHKRLDDQTRQAIDRERQALQQQLQNISQKYNVEAMAGRTTAETIKQSFLQAAQAVAAAVAAAAASANFNGSSSNKGGWDLNFKDDGKGNMGGKGGGAPPPKPGGGSSGFSSGSYGAGGGGGGANQFSGGFSSGSVGNRKFAAAGGIAPRGKQVDVRMEQGRNYDEAFLPLDPETIARAFGPLLSGLTGGSASGGNTTVEINGDINIGEGNGVTRAEVSEALDELGYAIAEAIQEKRIGAG